jgi:hypothetical protein
MKFNDNTLTKRHVVDSHSLAMHDGKVKGEHALILHVCMYVLITFGKSTSYVPVTFNIHPKTSAPVSRNNVPSKSVSCSFIQRRMVDVS